MALFLLGFIILVSLALFFVRDLVSFVVISGIISGLSTMFYIVNFSPDVAITEAAVGSSVSAIFFIMAIYCCKYNEKWEISKITMFNVLVVAICVTLFLLFTYLVFKMQKYGSSFNVIHQKIADYYIKNTKSQFGIPNIVTAILGGYRGLDTLFETTVIFAAAMGVRSILSTGKDTN